MACSGIAEHNEARRKAGRAELLAYRKKELMDRFTDNDMNGIVNGGGTYAEEILRKSGYPSGANSPNCAANVDRQRRNGTTTTVSGIFCKAPKTIQFYGLCQSVVIVSRFLLLTKTAFWRQQEKRTLKSTLSFLNNDENLCFKFQ